MTASTPILIHEFSTGILAERATDGGWFSRGFTGEYMNTTIDSIPTAIQDAISNREFAVAEGASSDDPATIGRDIMDSEGGWSVVAIVTRGRDDRGRNPSVYRYFFCEGVGNLPKILAWLNSQRQAGKNAIFDPFDSQVIGQPHQYWDSESVSIPIHPKLQDYLTQSPPIVIPHDFPCAPLILDRVARQIADEQPVAWAYKVEALEQTRSFHIIQPGSSKAQELIEKTLASTPRDYIAVSGEQAIKSAVSGLISRDKVKLEQLQTIDTALTNPQIDDNYWNAIFDGKGANQAKSQDIYSPQMVRLLTLQAMVIPETLPNFLIWMSKREKQKDHYEVSERFQVEIQNVLTQVPNLANQIIQGVLLIIPKLINRPELLMTTTWLLKSHQGAWGYFYEQQVKKCLVNDLTLMPRYVRKKEANLPFQLIADPEWNKIFQELQGYWAIRHNPKQQKYLPLAQLFERLGDYQTANFFYHVVFEKVPKKIFFQIRPGGYYCQVFGVRIEREISWYEYLLLFFIQLGETIVPFKIVIVLLITTLGVGFFSGSFSEGRKSTQKITDTAQELKNTKAQLEVFKEQENNLKSAPYMSTAKEKYSETEKAINKLVNEIKDLNQTPKDNQTIKNTINQVLLKPDLLIPYELVSKETEPKEELLIRAIYDYQKQKSILKENADGIISQPQKNKEEEAKTYNALKCDVAQKLKIPHEQLPDCKSAASDKTTSDSYQSAPDGK